MKLTPEQRKAITAKYGVEGGKPPEYPPCTAHKPYRISSGKIKVRHRFVKGICACGVMTVPALYRFEDRDGQRVWYVKEGTSRRQF